MSLLFIGDIEQELNCCVSTFADDTKLGFQVDTCSNILTLQNDLDTVAKWADKWGMQFNVDK